MLEKILRKDLNIAARFLMNRAAYIMLFLKDYWYHHRDRNIFAVLDGGNSSVAGGFDYSDCFLIQFCVSPAKNLDISNVSVL